MHYGLGIGFLGAEMLRVQTRFQICLESVTLHGHGSIFSCLGVISEDAASSRDPSCAPSPSASIAPGPAGYMDGWAVTLTTRLVEYDRSYLNTRVCSIRSPCTKTAVAPRSLSCFQVWHRIREQRFHEFTKVLRFHMPSSQSEFIYIYI